MHLSACRQDSCIPGLSLHSEDRTVHQLEVIIFTLNSCPVWWRLYCLSLLQYLVLLLHGALSWMSETCLRTTLLWWWFPTESYFSSLRAVFKCIFCVSIFDIWLTVTASTAAIASYLYFCICSAYLYCYSYIKEQCQWAGTRKKWKVVHHDIQFHMLCLSACQQHQCYPSTSGYVLYSLRQWTIWITKNHHLRVLL